LEYGFADARNGAIAATAKELLEEVVAESFFFKGCSDRWRKRILRRVREGLHGDGDQFLLRTTTLTQVE
jgi:hypothetical protein